MSQKKKGKVGSSSTELTQVRPPNAAERVVPLALGAASGGSCAFDSFLAEQGILEDCEEQAIKQILADQIKAAMDKDRLTKAAMAVRMQTSRRALDRLLDPNNTSVTLHTLQRAALAIWPPDPP